MGKRVRYSSNQVVRELEVWLRIFQESLWESERAGATMETLRHCKGKIAAVELMLSFWRKKAEV